MRTTLALAAAMMAATSTANADVMTGREIQSTVTGKRIYLATPRLRGLLALSLAVSAAGSVVIVNTV
eukprot:gene14296-19307_t